MSTTTSARLAQPALVGGAFIGVLSALPLISAGNYCCCLWVVSGGALAAYLLQERQPTAITPGDGALAGLLAGLVGAGIYLVLSIPVTLVMAPLERAVIDRVLNEAPELRDYLARSMGVGMRIAFGFLLMLIVGSAVATVGGVLGALVFKKQLPPGTIDVPPPSV